MNSLGVSEARQKLPQLIDEVDQQLGRLFITKNGKAKAVLLSADEFDSWIETLASYQDKETLKRSQELDLLLKNKTISTLQKEGELLSLDAFRQVKS